jgi:hypothetical protein
VQTENIPFMVENFIDLQNTRGEVIEGKIKSCNYYIGIFHEKRGSFPQKDNPELLSSLQLNIKLSRA